MSKTVEGSKTCSRGHTYAGSGPCPVCWPGGAGKGKTKAKARIRG